MEALVLLLGEFLFSLFGGLLLILAVGVLLLFSWVFSLFGWRLNGTGAERSVTEVPSAVSEKPPAVKRVKPRWMTVAQRVLLLVLALSLIAAFLVNTVFFEPALRQLTEAVGRRTGLELTFSQASGSFLPGRVELNDVVIRKADTSGSCFDLSAKQISVSFNLLALLGKTANVEGLEIEALNGTFNRVSSPGYEETEPQQKSLKARRTFVIEALRIHEASLVIEDESRAGEVYTLPVTIDRLEGVPLRSSFAVCDILFRANAAGTVSGQPFFIRTQLVPEGRSTQWHAQNLPVALLSHYVGTPFNLLQEGVVDVDVEDFWRLGRKAEIDTNWSLEFRDVVAGVPPNIEPWANLFAEPVVEYINNHNEKVSIRFGFTMNENEFKAAASLDAAGLWKELSRAFIKEVSSRLDISDDQLKSDISDGFNHFKNFLDEKRKVKAHQSE